MPSLGEALVLSAVVALATAPLRAQCPDGTPPPCTRPAPPPANSVAVLYFENQSRDSTDAYLAVGLTEAIIARLGDVPRLAVKSRFLVRRYQGAGFRGDPAEIGRALGVAYIVTGSVQRAASHLRVTAELARAAGGDRVWGQQYERGDGDVFAIEEDVARGVATGIAGRLLPGEQASLAARPTRNNEAYDHLIRGDVLLSQRTEAAVLRAIGEYEAAARLDPVFVPAWSRIALAEATRWQWNFGDGGAPTPDSVLQSGIAAADGALALDSLSSDAWTARGALLEYTHPLDWSAAEEALRRAVALNPRNAEAWNQLGFVLELRQYGHPNADSIRTAAVQAYRQALAAEPSRPVTLVGLAYLLPVAERMPLVDSALVLDPTNTFSLFARADAQSRLGDTAASRVTLELAERLAPPGRLLFARANRASVTALAGDTAIARQLVAGLLADVGPLPAIAISLGSPLARTLLRLGDWEHASDVLERVPRGVRVWAGAQLYAVPPAGLAYPRLRRLVEENRPSWAR